MNRWDQSFWCKSGLIPVLRRGRRLTEPLRLDSVVGDAIYIIQSFEFGPGASIRSHAFDTGYKVDLLEYCNPESEYE